MAANGISTLSTKQARQVAKLGLAQTKRQGSFTRPNNGSVLLDGTQSLTVPANSAYTLGTNDHTIEFWLYQSGRGLYDIAWNYSQQGAYSTSAYYLNVGSAGVALLLGTGTEWGVFINPPSPSLDAWHHYAIVRYGNVFTLYIDGVGYSNTYAANIPAQPGVMSMGGMPGGDSVPGYFSNFRFVNGTAVYTQDFTPSEATLPNVPNTKILLNTVYGSNFLVDSSSIGATVTNVGGGVSSPQYPNAVVTVDTSAPFYRSRAFYDITQLPTQYNDNEIIDNPNEGGLVVGRPWIAVNYTISPNASAVNEGDTITYTITTVGVADGTTLYWTNSGTTVGADFTGTANSGSFTVNSGTATFTRVLANDYLTEGTETVIVDIRTGSTSGPIVATSGPVSVADTSIPVVDQYGYFEQQLVAGTYMTFDQTISGQSLRFICTNFDGVPTYGSYIRVNGVMVASDHTLSPDSFDNSVVGGSLALSGSNELVIASTTDFGFGTGDFTVEAYVNATNLTGTALFDFRTTATESSIYLNLNSTGNARLYVSGAYVITTTSAISTGTWAHVALVRSSGSTKIYINGTQSGSTYTDTNDYGTTKPLSIGSSYTSASHLTGYMTSIRVVKGSAVYTANFTKSPNPLLPVTNTKLLLTELTSGDLLKDTSPSNQTITNNGTVTWNSATPFTPGNPTTKPNPVEPPDTNGLGFCMRRGHTIVALNAYDGTIQSINWYDTWLTPSLGTTVAALLRTFLPGTIVAIGTFDATAVNQDFRDCLTNYFGDTTFSNTWGRARISQMFLGIVKKKILAFNGSSNRIQVGGTRADWNLAYSWTIEFWSKAAVSTTSGALLTIMSQQPNSGTIDIFLQNGDLIINNGTHLCAEPTPGVWTHVAIVVTAAGAGGIKVYYNGVSVSGITAGGYNLPDTANDLWIGRRGNNDYQYFNGKLANIRISNTPRYSATFTPPLTLVTDANTKLALDGNLVDRSASAHTITNTGTTASNLDFPT